jgi:hypothetical protein
LYGFRGLGQVQNGGSLTEENDTMKLPHIDYSDNADMKKTLKQAAGTGAAFVVVALVPAEAPVALAAAATVGAVCVGMLTAKGVGALWDLIMD